MPNKLLITTLIAALLLAGCAVTPTDPSLVAGAEAAIAQAEAAGADEHAPQALQRARIRVEAAYEEIDNRSATAAKRLADQAELDARLAVAISRSAREQAELERRRQAVEQLHAELRREFGPEFDNQLERQ